MAAVTVGARCSRVLGAEKHCLRWAGGGGSCVKEIQSRMEMRHDNCGKIKWGDTYHSRKLPDPWLKKEPEI